MPSLVVFVLTMMSGVAALSAQNLEFHDVGSIPGPASLITVHGERAYVSAEGTLTIYDVSSPTSPARLGAYTFPSAIWGVLVNDPFVYVAADTFGLGILDVSDPRAPRLRGSFKTPGQAKNVAVSGTTALVADQLEGILVLDVSNPDTPVEVASGFLEGFATDVVFSGTLAYAADRPTGLYVLDLSVPGGLEIVSALQSAEPLVFGTAQLKIIRPTQESAFVVLVSAALLQPFNISDPAHPVQLPAFGTPGGVRRAAFAHNLAYVADAENGLFVVDLATPASPRIVGRHETGLASADVAVAGTLVFLTARGEDVLILQQTAQN